MTKREPDLRIFRGRCYGCLDTLEISLKAELPPPANRSIHEACGRGLIVWDMAPQVSNG